MALRWFAVIHWCTLEDVLNDNLKTFVSQIVCIVKEMFENHSRMLAGKITDLLLWDQEITLLPPIHKQPFLTRKRVIGSFFPHLQEIVVSQCVVTNSKMATYL